MDIPILKYVDVLIGFALVMILATTVITSVTQLLATLLRSRGRCLRSGLEALLTQVDSTNLEAKAREISDAVLRHPMIGKPTWKWFASAVGAVWKFCGRAAPKLPEVSRGGVVKREELVRILLELAGGDKPGADKLRTVFGFDKAGAAAALKEIEAEALKLESSNPKEASYVRETQALVKGIATAGEAASAVAAKVTAWFDQSMERVTHAYAANAKVVTALVSLGLVVVLQLDSLDLLRRLSVDDKMRAALVQQAEKYEKKIEQSKTQPPTTAPAAPADDIAVLKKQKDEIDASIADLSQPSLGILTHFYRSRTQPPAALSSSQYLLAVGTKTYRLARNQNEGFWEFAKKIDALDAGVKACVYAYPKSQYGLSVRSVVPNVKTLELRADPQGANLLGPVESYYSWANLGRAWMGILLSWILLSLGSPFWYDLLKNLLQLRPLLAKQEEKERAERQKAQ